MCRYVMINGSTAGTVINTTNNNANDNTASETIVVIMKVPVAYIYNNTTNGVNTSNAM